MEPLFTNDAVVLGLLLIVLALIFHTNSLDHPFWKKFYRFCPALLLCYFVPALMNWPLGWMASSWYDMGIVQAIQDAGMALPSGFNDYNFEQIQKFISEQGQDVKAFAAFKHSSSLYYVASRYLLPASLILLCISIDFKGILNLGPKALIMFFAATIGIILGGPVALILLSTVAPGLIQASPEELWRGLSTVAGSWIGGGANQTAMKEIYKVSDRLFASMIVVDVVVANIWMGFLLYGASVSDKIDDFFKADNTAITDLKNNIASYRLGIEEIPTTTKLFVMLAIAFGGVAFSHWASDVIVPFMTTFKQSLVDMRLNSLMSGFFWLIVCATTIGMLLSLTRFRKLEGIGASKWGSICIYILVATIGMKMNISDIFDNLGIFAIGLVWMLVHVTILLITAKVIRAPFFFVAVGSQANVGGAASAPIVASAFSPSLAPVGVLMAVLGYALGTYGAIICAELMHLVAG